MITGAQLRAARVSIGWEPRMLAMRAKVPLGALQRAENSPGEPMITVAQLMALMQVLHAAGASFLLVDPDQNVSDTQP